VTDPHPAVRAVPASTDLDARYGRTGRRHRPLVLGVIATLAAVALVWLLWVAFISSNPPVSSRLLGFTITSPTSATATIQSTGASPSRPSAGCRRRRRTSRSSGN